MLIHLLLLLSLTAQAQGDWLAELRPMGAHVCGSTRIQPTKKSIARDFALGPEKKGFVLTGMPSIAEYFGVLTEQNLEGAKSGLQERFGKAHLWVHSPKAGLVDLGAPEGVEFPFKATVKDCVEGARTTLGNDCSRFAAESRAGCCREKFVGPVLRFKGGHRLMYSPDPSVRLKVAGEKAHRFCDVQKTL